MHAGITIGILPFYDLFFPGFGSESMDTGLGRLDFAWNCRGGKENCFKGVLLRVITADLAVATSSFARVAGASVHKPPF